MYKDHPIKCPKCGQQITTEENEMFKFNQDDIKCPHCGAVVISIPKVEF